jgi:hypothetical protein
MSEVSERKPVEVQFVPPTTTMLRQQIDMVEQQQNNLLRPPVSTSMFGGVQQQPMQYRQSTVPTMPPSLVCLFSILLHLILRNNIADEYN